mgnify:CR=1 FL=1
MIIHFNLIEGNYYEHIECQTKPFDGIDHRDDEDYHYQLSS